MNHLSESIGNFVSAKKNESGLFISAQNASCTVQIYSENIFRINIEKGQTASENFSYAVIQTPLKIKFNITEKKDKIEISTGSLKLIISKFPLRFSFYSLCLKSPSKKNNEILLNEDDAFGTSWIGTEVTTYKKLQEGEKFVGLGEKNGNLNRRGEKYTHWNTDQFAYPINHDPLYCSTPFYIGIHNHSSYGIFLDNTHKTEFDFGSSNERFSSFSAANGSMDYYFVHHPSIADIIKSYTWLTGRMELPPSWSLGFQQCRYSYYPESEVLNIAKTFREKDIPCDGIYLDIHYMDEYKVFTWHPSRFPHPEKLITALKKMGFNLIVIIDPGVKREAGYDVYEEGKKQNHFVKFPNGDEYVGQVWPGWSCFPDFTSAKTRKWWGQKIKLLTDAGVEGFWNDMNEPTALGKHLPDLIEFLFEGERANHKKAKNIYGMQMARATFEGAKMGLNKRPFSLTRAGFSGVQRYSAVWTGDNVSSDEHMLAGVRLLNSMGLAGISFCGYDVGGFAGEASPELFARWITIGAFSPLFRCHSMINTRDAEPWSFGEEVEDIARNYIKLRYRLFPYIYSSFYESTQNGVPIQKSLVVDFFDDEKIFHPDFQNQYLFGKNILVAPLESRQEIAKIYLPGEKSSEGNGGWYDFFTDAFYKSGQEIYSAAKKEKLPVFVKSGSIIPMQSCVPDLKKKPLDVLFLHLYLGSDGDFEYYEDDGSTFQYQQENYYKRKITFSQKGKKILFEIPRGKYRSCFKTIKLLLHGFEKTPEVFLVNGQRERAKPESFKFFEPVHHFDYFPKQSEDPMVLENIPALEIENFSEKFEILWK